MMQDHLYGENPRSLVYVRDPVVLCCTAGEMTHTCLQGNDERGRELTRLFLR